MSRDREVRKVQRRVMWNGSYVADVCRRDMPAVDHVELREGAIANVADGNMSLQNGSLGGREMLSGQIQGILPVMDASA